MESNRPAIDLRVGVNGRLFANEFTLIAGLDCKRVQQCGVRQMLGLSLWGSRKKLVLSSNKSWSSEFSRGSPPIAIAFIAFVPSKESLCWRVSLLKSLCLRPSRLAGFVEEPEILIAFFRIRFDWIVFLIRFLPLNSQTYTSSSDFQSGLENDSCLIGGVNFRF